jgi:hypothetical protein
MRRSAVRSASSDALSARFVVTGACLLTAGGERFTVTRSDQISSRLDTAALKAFLGDACRKFETVNISTVIRIKPVLRIATAA